jgi:hypothetical protein
LFRVVLAAAALLFVSIGYAAFQYYHSSYWTRVGLASDQPVLFSHRHHAGELRIDCRNCHATVETAAFAGMPSTQTCLACHSQIFADTTMLRAVVLSAERGEPLHWNRVAHLPDHVFFNHGIHVAKGVRCTTCHGDVGNMALLAKGESLSMRWCLDCHRDPGPRLGAREEIFSARAIPENTNPLRAAELLHANGIRVENLTNCSTCHH